MSASSSSRTRRRWPRARPRWSARWWATPFRVAYTGGDPDGGLGTSVEGIMAAIERAWSPAGVAILVDLGGAETNSEMAVEMLPADRRGEGRGLQRADRRGRRDRRRGSVGRLVARGRQAHRRGVEPVRVESETMNKAAANAMLTNEVGLHARPSVKLTQLAKSFKASVELALAPDGPWTDAKSPVQVMRVKAGEGLSPPRARRGRGCAGRGRRRRRPRRAQVRRGVSVMPATAPHRSARLAGPGARARRGCSEPPAENRRAAGDPAAEATALRAAIGRRRRPRSSRRKVRRRRAPKSSPSRSRMLEDDALAADAFAEIAAGVPADHAWRGALDREIAGYEAAEDEYFRARAAISRIMRDRVLDALTGASARAIPPGSIVFADGPRRPPASSPRTGPAVPSSSPTAARRATWPCWRVAAACRWWSASGTRRARAGQSPSEAIVDGDRRASSSSVPTQRTSTSSGSLEISGSGDRWPTMPPTGSSPAVTADGTPIAVHVNIADLRRNSTASTPPPATASASCARNSSSAARAARRGAASVAVYRRIAEWAAGKPVTIRTLDAGGDKPIPGSTEDGETNPFLGLRGVRLTLKHSATLSSDAAARARPRRRVSAASRSWCRW